MTRIDEAEAEATLAEAFQQAAGDSPASAYWTEAAEFVFSMKSMTYTPAFATALLARATDPTVDPLSLKASYGADTYSARQLCHRVIVPSAPTLGFSIRNTGREPLNNQPFFRYEHMSLIDKVRNRSEHDRFMTIIRRLARANSSESFAALVAFLRIAISQSRSIRRIDFAFGKTSPLDAIVAVDLYLSSESERPARTQALVAAAFDVTHTDVRSRRINDPSRDWPGDVQAFVDDYPILSVEVRAKSVSVGDALSFVRACASRMILRAFIVVLWPAHTPLNRSLLRERAWSDHAVLLTIFESAEELLSSVLAWSSKPLQDAVQHFVTCSGNRLVEIGVTPEGVESWISLLSVDDPSTTEVHGFKDSSVTSETLF